MFLGIISAFPGQSSRAQEQKFSKKFEKIKNISFFLDFGQNEERGNGNGIW